jgi:AraC family transcriptional regulator
MEPYWHFANQRSWHLFEPQVGGLETATLLQVKDNPYFVSDGSANSGNLVSDTLQSFQTQVRASERNVSANALSHHRLQRVLKRMETDLSATLTLKTLATESGYSRNHFLRMFRAAMGCTPHQYLLRLRVGKAQAMMHGDSIRLIDVALACGFSSHAHLSRIFRQVTGSTPSEYRRGI